VTEYAVLEIGLYHQDDSFYRVDAGLRLPDSESDSRISVKVPRFDLQALGAVASDQARYGQTLADYLFASPELVAFYREARAAATARGEALRVRLSIDKDAYELHELCWEMLRDPLPRSNRFLCADEKILFSRYLSSQDLRPITAQPKGDLKALVVVANPDDLDAYGLAEVNVPGELKRAKEGLGKIPMEALCRCQIPPCPELDVDIIGRPTLNALVECLRGGYDVLYLVCHGNLSSEDAGSKVWVPRVWLEDEEGKADPVSAAEEVRPGGWRRPGLVTRLSQLQDLPRLMVLASCQSAGEADEWASTDGGALAALGPRLAEIGVPAVVAMQGNVTMETVARFMPEFFRELDRDGQIDRAIAAARAGIIDLDRPDWWVPVLFTRLESGRLFVEGPGADGGGPDDGGGPVAGGYRLDVVHELLMAGFNADSLKRLCFYSSHKGLRDLVNQFSPRDSLTDRVQTTIEYCTENDLMSELLAEAKLKNPRQYARFESSLRG
jgi:hypothetical protein